MGYFVGDLEDPANSIGPETDPHLEELAEVKASAMGEEYSIRKRRMWEVRDGLEGVRMELKSMDLAGGDADTLQEAYDNAAEFVDHFVNAISGATAAQIDAESGDRYLLYGENLSDEMVSVEIGGVTVKSPYTAYAEILVEDGEAEGEILREHPRQWVERVASLG